MRTKVVAIAAASLLTAGIGVHITHHCPLRDMFTKTTSAQTQTPKEVKAPLVANR